MKFSEEQVEDLTMAMFEDADTNSRGAITYEALKHQLEKHGGLLENLTIRFVLIHPSFGRDFICLCSFQHRPMAGSGKTEGPAYLDRYQTEEADAVSVDQAVHEK